MPTTARAGSPALVLTGVSRRHGSRAVLAPLTLTLDAGARAVVTGTNGSGKTTLLRVAAGLLAPSTGVRRAAGPALYLRPGSGARRHEAVADAVSVAARLAGSPDDPRDLVDDVGLSALADRPSGQLSAGERARLSLAIALAARPPLVCLDEPTEHLDTEGRGVAVDVLRRLAGHGCAVLVAVHDGEQPPEADATLRLRGGRLVRA